MTKLKTANIKYQLMIKGTSQREAARKIGVSESMLSMVISGTRRSKRIEKALARMVGVRHEVLFGEAVAA